jgi:hypothetical protein
VLPNSFAEQELNPEMWTEFADGSRFLAGGNWRASIALFTDFLIVYFGIMRHIEHRRQPDGRSPLRLLFSNEVQK